MSQENIIPNQIPVEVFREKRYDDIILYVLSAFGPLERSEFINSPNDDINNRMNKNTFHKWVKELKSSNYIEVEKNERKSVYSITELGLDELLRRLSRYQLDFDTINKIEQQRIKRYINSIKQFFAKYEIYNEDIKAEFIELANEITHDKLIFFPEIKFNKLLLFICLNHPKFYPIYSISKQEFISTYNMSTDSENEELTLTDVDMFLQRIFEEKIYGDKIYRLNLEKNEDSLYFRVNGEYGSLLQIILKAKFKFLYNLNSLEIVELNNEWLEDTYEYILNILIDKLKCFNEDLRESLNTLIKEFTSKLVEKIKKNPMIDRETLSYYSITSILDSKDDHFSPKYDSKEEKELEKKLQDVNEKLKNEPLNHENLLLKSETLYRLNREEEALVTINKALKLNPPDISKYLISKALIFNDKKFLDIIGSGLKIRGKVKANFFITFIKHTTRRSLKFVNKAIKYEKNLINLSLFHQIQADFLFNLEEYDEALKSINKAIELNNSSSDSNWKDHIGYENFYKLKGMILFRLKEVDESKKLIEKAVKEKLLSIQEEIEYYSRTDDYTNAIMKLDILIKDNPEDIKLLRKKARFLTREGKYEKSNDILDSILEKDENLNYGLRNKFRNYLLMRDYDNALILIDQIYKSTPNDRIRKFEDLYLIFSNKKNYKEALYFLNKLIELILEEKEILRYLLFKSRILIKLRKYNEALEFHENSIGRFSDDPEEVENVKSNEALILAHLGRRENAINIMESLLQHKSENKNVTLYKYGKILMVLKEYEGAIKKFQDSQKIKPKGIAPLFKIAKSYDKLNDYKSALENLNKVKKIAENRIKDGFGIKSYSHRSIEKANKKIEELKGRDSNI